MGDEWVGPISQAEAEQAIEHLATRLEEETEKLLSLGIVAANAEVEYKARRSKLILTTEGPEYIRTATHENDQETQKLLAARRIAEVQYTAQRELLSSLRARLEALRSVNANVRTQV